MQKMIKGTIACYILICFIVPTQFLKTAFALDSDYEWKNVAFGGGGYVTGMVMHPTAPDLIYVRTDVGGAYRWEQMRKKWVQLLDWIPAEQSNLYGVDGIALDANNPEVVYIACGKYGNGDVLKSTDRGLNWTSTGLKKNFAGNMDKRWNGEPIAVDPVNSNRVFVTTRGEGLYKSENAASAWTLVSNFPAYANGVGRSIVFDKSSAADGETQILYVGINNIGIYQSMDAGQTWNFLEGSPVQPSRMEVASDGTLYVAASNGVYQFKNDTWKNISPAGAQMYKGISIHPTDPNTLVVINDKGNDGRVYESHVYRSVNGGENWQDMYNSQQRVNTVSWWPTNYFCASPSDIKINPVYPNQVWVADWYGVWKTLDITAQPKQTWTNEVKGLEEMVGFTMSCPPAGGRLIAGVGDNGGARWTNVNEYPSTFYGNLTIQDTNSVDFCEEDAEYVVRVGGNRDWGGGNGGISTNNGISWTAFANYPTGIYNNVTRRKLIGRVAVSAKKDKNSGIPTIVTMNIGDSTTGNILYSKDGGVTWQESTGAPKGLVQSVWTWHRPLASDRVNPNVFYIHHDSKFYTSVDGGVTFQHKSTLSNNWSRYVKAAPGMEGEVWVSKDTNGLYASSDYGSSFRKIPHVEEARLFGFGKEAVGRVNPTVFVYGKVDGVRGIFRSSDMGASWERINDDQHLIGDEPNDLEGDRQTFGVVYISTNGRGYFYGTPRLEEEITNVAYNKPVKVKQYEDTHTEDVNGTNYASNAVDGVCNDASRWVSSNRESTHWLDIDLQQPCKLYSATIYSGFSGSYPLTDFKLQKWDGVNWVDISGASVTSNQRIEMIFNFEQPVITNKVRVYITGSPDNYARVKEVMLFGIPEYLRVIRAQLLDSSGNPLDMTKNISGAQAEVVVANDTNTPKNVSVMLALYKANELMQIKMKSEKITQEDGERTIQVELSNLDGMNASEGYRLKTFVWKNTEALEPLVKVISSQP